MVKVALLIAVSEYEHGLPSLPGSKRDIQEMERVLRDPNMGEFDDVKPLLNPDLVTMQIEIERLFAEGRQKDDLVLLYFSGHGFPDEHDNLYFATRETRQNQQEEYLTATAVPAQTIQGFMNRSLSKRQVLILDCCFSGAFAQGLSATGRRGSNSVPIPIETQLGGEGRAVLTSSTAKQWSFEEGGVGIYTRFIVEGIETGAADTDKNGIITVEELHEYAKWKTQAARSDMKPNFFPVKEGYAIRLAKAPIGDYKLTYRKEVELWAQRRQGKFSSILLSALEENRKKLGLSLEEAEEIMAEVLQPTQEFQEKRLLYEQNFEEAILLDFPVNEEIRDELRYLQQILGLRDIDVASIEDKFNERKFTSAETYFDRGLKNYEKKNNEGAIRNYTKAIQLKPNYSVAYFNRGLAYHNLGNYQAAIEDYTEAIRINSEWGTINLARAYLERGVANYDSGNKQIALEDYTQSINHEAKSSRTYYERGLTYFDLKDYQAAIDDYTQAIKLNSTSYELDEATIYLERGLAYYDSNHKQAALEDWNQASVLKPNYCLAFYNQGLVHENNKDYQAAIQAYTQAIEVNGQWESVSPSEAYYRRGLCQYELGQFQASVEDYTQAIKIDSEFDLAYEKRGDAYHALENKELAIENYRQAESLYQKLFKTTEFQKVRRKIRHLEQ
jgi:tetratricopeptide (TPR) repeat protein